MENNEGIWMHETHRRATGAPPDTQMQVCLRRILMCEENMQKVCEHRDSGEVR